MKSYTIDRKWLRLEELEKILGTPTQLVLDDATRNEIQKCSATFWIQRSVIQRI